MAAYCSFCWPFDVTTQFGSSTATGYNWVMQNVLPQQAGLEVSGVFYRYTAVKDPASDMVVFVQNKDALNPNEYIFREKDDWSGLEGKTINKYLPQPNTVIDRWGDGSIEIQGEGQVVDPTVVYSYRYDPCFDPQSNPTCPGFNWDLSWLQDPDLTSYWAEQQMLLGQDNKNKKYNEDESDEEDRERRQNKSKERQRVGLEAAMSAVNTSLLSVEAVAKHNALMAMSVIPTSYNKEINGGTYEDAPMIPDAKLPDNPSARRVNFAQSILHDQMVDQQYEKLNGE